MYSDEVEPLGQLVVLRNFESQAAMTLIDKVATEEARKVIMLLIMVTICKIH